MRTRGWFSETGAFPPGMTAFLAGMTGILWSGRARLRPRRRVPGKGAPRFDRAARPFAAVVPAMAAFLAGMTGILWSGRARLRPRRRACGEGAPRFGRLARPFVAVVPAMVAFLAGITGILGITGRAWQAVARNNRDFRDYREDALSIPSR